MCSPYKNEHQYHTLTFIINKHLINFYNILSRKNICILKKMENKRMAMLVVLMLVMGNLLTETEAVSFLTCYEGSLYMCISSAKGLNKLLCPFTGLKDCIHPIIVSEEANIQEITNDYICKLGCSLKQCVSLSSIEDKGKLFSSCIIFVSYIYTL